MTLPEFAIFAPALLYGVFIAASTALCAIDLREHRLPDLGTVSLAAAGLILAQMPWWPLRLPQAADGLALGWAVPVLGELVYRARRAGRSGTGLGDAKYLAAIGAWFGPVVAALVWATATALALVWSWLARFKREFAMGPWIFAALLLVLSGEWMTRALPALTRGHL